MVVDPMPYKILVVDDNDINLALVGKILELEGYQILPAHNCTEAVDLLLSSTPDLAILDVMMPDMDGYELCMKFREPPINATMPIVMLTAMNSPTERLLALKAGANDIWSKPFDMDAFRQRIGDLLKAANPKDS
jgi:CheY-like chemotaxis protein